MRAIQPREGFVVEFFIFVLFAIGREGASNYGDAYQITNNRRRGREEKGWRGESQSTGKEETLSGKATHFSKLVLVSLPVNTLGMRYRFCCLLNRVLCFL